MPPLRVRGGVRRGHLASSSVINLMSQPTDAYDPFLSDAPDRRGAGPGVVAVLAAAVVAALVAGIVGAFTVTGSGTTSAGGRASAGESSQLGTRLLGAGDLPAGWTLLGAINDAVVGRDAFDGPISFAVGCLSRPVDAGRRAEAEVELVQGPAQVPILNEAVAVMPPGRAATAYSSLAGELKGCHTVGGQGQPGVQPGATGQVQAVAIPSVGDQSSGWQIIVNTAGQQASEVLVAVRQGDDLALVAYGTLGHPDPAAAASYARRAVAKLA